MKDIRPALHDEVAEVRKTALESLAKLVDEANDYILNDFITKLRDENKDVRLTAVDLLGKFQYSQEVRNCLLETLQDPDDWVIIRTLDDLVKNGCLTDVDKVIELLDNSTQLVKIKSIEALGSVGGRKACRKLLELLNDENPDIQNAAEEAFSQICRE